MPSSSEVSNVVPSARTVRRWRGRRGSAAARDIEPGVVDEPLSGDTTECAGRWAAEARRPRGASGPGAALRHRRRRDDRRGEGCRPRGPESGVRLGGGRDAWPGAMCTFSVPAPTGSTAQPPPPAPSSTVEPCERARELGDRSAGASARQRLVRLLRPHCTTCSRRGRPAPTSWTSRLPSALVPPPIPLCYRTDVQSAGYVSEIFVSFQGEGLYAGRRQLFLRMGGCHLRCRYCDTPDSLERTPHYRASATGPSGNEANPVEPDRLAASIATS